MLMIIGLAVLTAGCETKIQAETGKEWLDNIQAASKKNDTEALWKMCSKGAQDYFVEMAKMTKKKVQSKEALKRVLEIDADPKTISEIDLAKLLLGGKTGFASEMETYVYVSEKKDGDKIEVTFKSGGIENQIFLIKEEGTLKMVELE